MSVEPAHHTSPENSSLESESPTKSALLNNIWSFLLRGLPEDATLEQRERTAMANAMSMIGILIMLVFGSMAIFEHNIVLAIVDFVAAAALIAITIQFHQTRRYEPLVITAIMLIAVAFTYFLASGGTRETAYMWHFSFPLFCTFLLGSKKGLIISSGLFVVACVYFLFDPFFRIGPTIVRISKFGFA